MWLTLSIFAAQFCLFFIFSLKRVVGADHCTDTTADPRPRVCQLAVCTSCGRVTKRWPEISLRLHLVLDSEKEVDLPTEPSPQWMGDRLFNRRTRSDEISPCAHRVVLLEPASQPAFRSTRGLTHTDQSSTTTFLNPLPTYQTPYLPEFFGLCLSFWKWEKESWREISLQEPPSAVSLQVVVIRPSVLSSFASLYLLFLPLSPKVTKNQTPWQALIFMVKEKCTGLM